MRQVTENTLTRSWQKFRENNLHYLKNTVQKMKNLSHQKNISSNQVFRSLYSLHCGGK